ncbi:unnamed protein product [Macrosiphum euphorbiae]|uniref:Uncharacterized protein n=1 Tax=Macrosiphum euphorbiae TaxID=13131 RepID=A0AAV0W4I6_9HEMI|nr:unnamed protein product [Macrosiphum euphorbiae]
MVVLYSNVLLYFPADVADKQVRLDMFEFVSGTIEQTAALVTGALYELAKTFKITSESTWTACWTSIRNKSQSTNWIGYRAWKTC